MPIYYFYKRNCIRLKQLKKNKKKNYLIQDNVHFSQILIYSRDKLKTIIQKIAVSSYISKLENANQ